MRAAHILSSRGHRGIQRIRSHSTREAVLKAHLRGAQRERIRVAEPVDDQRQIAAAPRRCGERAARRRDDDDRLAIMSSRANAKASRKSSCTGFAAPIIFWNSPNSVCI